MNLRAPLFAAPLLAGIVLSASVAGAAPKPIKALPVLAATPDDAQKQHARVRKLVPSATFDKAQSSGKALANKSVEKMTASAVADAATTSAASFLTMKGDVSAIAFLVLMEAAKSAEEDLRAIMAGVKKINSEREKLRDAIKERQAKVKAAKKAPPPLYLKKVTTAKSPNLQLAYSVVPDAAATCENSDPELCLDELQQKLDALGEMSEVESMRLQMVMDRRSKFIEALSNILKKTSETAETIISNMK